MLHMTTGNNDPSVSVNLDSLSAWAYRQRLVIAVAVARALLAKVDAAQNILTLKPASASSPHRSRQARCLFFHVPTIWSCPSQTSSELDGGKMQLST